MANLWIIKRSKIKQKFSFILIVFISAFLLNWAWENLHAPLYFHPDGREMTQSMLFWAAVGDAVYITLIAIPFSIFPYFKERVGYAFLFGVIIAIAIELHALNTGRWAYKSSMPVIPFLGTGLTPTIQLGFLAYIILKILKRLQNKY